MAGKTKKIKSTIVMAETLQSIETKVELIVEEKTIIVHKNGVYTPTKVSEIDAKTLNDIIKNTEKQYNYHWKQYERLANIFNIAQEELEKRNLRILII